MDKEMLVTRGMMYDQMVAIVKHIERLEKRIDELDNRIRQYSARVALAIDGDTENDDKH